MTTDPFTLSERGREDLAYLQQTLADGYRGFAVQPDGSWQVRLRQVYRNRDNRLDERLETHYGSTLEDALARARRATEDAQERVRGA